MRKTLVLFALFLGIAAACSSGKDAITSGSDDAETTESQDGTVLIDSGDTLADENKNASSSDMSDGSASSDSSNSATPVTTSTSSAGQDSKSPPTTQPYQIGAASGQTMAVVGVDYNDTLNFRTDPNPSASIVVSVPPLADNPAIVSQGQGVLTNNGAWWNVEVGGTQAWANVTFLASLGTSLPISNEITPKLPSQQAASAELLVKAVAGTRTGDLVKTTIVQQPEASDAIGGEVIFDVTGYLDDSVQGERIAMQYKFVWDNPTSANRSVIAYEFLSASSQALCSRGTLNGVCV